MKKGLFALVVALLGAAVVLSGVLAMTAPQDVLDTSTAIAEALNYLASQQQEDGGIDTFAMGSSNAGGTARAVLAVAAAGQPVGSIAHMTTENTMMDYLATEAIAYTHDNMGTLFPAEAGLLLSAVAAANEDPTNFGGMDLVGELSALYNPATGAYSSTAQGSYVSGAASDLNQAWTILGLSAAGESVPVTATDFLSNSQGVDGSWGYGSLDTTALAVVALIGSGNVAPTAAPVQSALSLFRSTQLPSAGWRPSWDTDPLNADTTGLVIQALVAAGYTPATASWAVSGGANPQTALMSLQQPDGRIGGTYANAYSTADALLGLTEQPLYFLGNTTRVLRALSSLSDLQNSDGSWSSFGFPDTGATVDVALAFASAGYDPHTVMAMGSTSSAMDYISDTATTYAANGPDAAGKLVLTFVAAGDDPADWDLVNTLQTYYSPTLGAFGVPTNTWHQAFAILGLGAAGESVPSAAVETLRNLQQADGGWKYDLNPAVWNMTGADNTGLAMQALMAVGEPATSTTIVSATAYLQNSQGTEGGWGNPNSTAFAIQGLLATDEDLGDEMWVFPFEALKRYQKVDGAFFYGGYFGTADNDYATRQSVPALMQVPFPLAEATENWQPVLRGPDPDRMVPAMPQAKLGNSIDVVIPFGSDVDGDGTVTLEWRPKDGASWMPISTQRFDGYFEAAVPGSSLTILVPYDFRATFSDPDGVQTDGGMMETEVLEITFGPIKTVFLPLIVR